MCRSTQRLQTDGGARAGADETDANPDQYLSRPVVDEDALFDAALTSDRIRGARLDVMVDEPPAAEYKLFTLQDVILTPHLAGPSWENWKKAFRNSFDNIERVARDEKTALDHPRAAGLTWQVSALGLPGSGTPSAAISLRARFAASCRPNSSMTTVIPSRPPYSWSRNSSTAPRWFPSPVSYNTRRSLNSFS